MAGQRNILIVEDDDGIRETLRLVLEVEEYRVSSAANGAEALDILHHDSSFCVILLDLMMPVMNGWDFVGYVQQDSKLSAIPIILVTAFAPEAGELMKKVKLVITKPVDVEILIKTLERYCRDPEG